MSAPQPRPAWFRLDPEGPHRQSGGRGLDGYSIEFYCAKDGQRWPCETKQARGADRH